MKSLITYFVEVSESHKSSSTLIRLPASEISNESSYNKRNGHKWYGHCWESVKVCASTIWISFRSNNSLLVWVSIPAMLIANGPESPEHSWETYKGSESSVENHVSLPLVAHVASSCNLEERENVPAEEENVAMSKVHRQTSLNVSVGEVNFILESGYIRVGDKHFGCHNNNYKLVNQISLIIYAL